MAYQSDPSYAANQQTYSHHAARYYPQVVIGPSPSQIHQQQNYAAYQAQNSIYVPPGIQQQQQEQRYPPHGSDINNALPPTPISVSNAKRESDDARRKRLNLSEPPLDYQVLLLSLAEEYFNAAHGQGSLVALAQREMEMDNYYKLVATGLGCLETVLKRWRLQPRLEATVRLRYASVLHKETNNYMEAETVLSTGITLCERLVSAPIDERKHRLLDLKYSMQHLLVRVLYDTKPKASLKSLDGIIKDVEAYKHIAWAYSFRFLHVSLSLDLASHQDTSAALQNLRRISATASSRGDVAIVVMTAILEALTHIRSSSSGESLEHAQSALATARSYQLDDTMTQLPQLSAMIHFVDIFCSLQAFDPAQALVKMQLMHSFMAPGPTDNEWNDDGSFAVSLTQPDLLQKDLGPRGIVAKDDHGRDVLWFKWLSRSDVFALAYFISGAVSSHRNAWVGQKAEKYFREGLRMIQENHETTFDTLSSAVARQQWRQTLYSYMQLHLCFALCARTDWEAALASIEALKEAVKSVTIGDTELLNALLLYINGVIQQSTGNLPGALSVFQSPVLALQPNVNTPHRQQTRHDLSILATLNTILILREPSQPKHSQLDSLLSAVEASCISHPDKNIVSAYYLVRATAHANDPIIKTKQYLQHALQAAKVVANNQLTGITLNFMSWKFFRGVVGDQAENSARASQKLAKKSGDRLWISVADGLLADTLEVQGKQAEAEAARKEATVVAAGLPVGVQRFEEGGTEEMCD